MAGEPASGTVNGFEIGNEGYVILNEPGHYIVIPTQMPLKIYSLTNICIC